MSVNYDNKDQLLTRKNVRYVMDQSHLEKYRKNLTKRAPLIGAWLQSHAVKTLTADGSAEAVRLLEEAVSQGDGEAPCVAALEALRQLAAGKNVPAQESLCRLVIYHNHPAAGQIVSTCRYVPRDDARRAVFYFLTEQWKEFEALDFDHHLLREAYDAADEQLRNRIAARARQAGRVDWVDVVSGGKQCRRLALMSDEEWRAAFTVLDANARWDELWRLAQAAPARWSALILQRLKKARWRPPEEDRAGFDELVRLSRNWKNTDFSRHIALKATLHGHRHEVRCLAVHPWGKLLASGSADNTVRLWGLPDGNAIKTLVRHSGWINCLAISPNGGVLASAGRDGRICLWSLPNGRFLGKLKGHIQPVYCLAFTPDSEILVSGSSDATIRLWGVRDKSSIGTLEAHAGGISCLVVSPDGNCLASGSADSTVKLWRLPDGKELQTMAGHRNVELDGVLCLALSPDGRTLASGGTDGRVILWRMPSGGRRTVLKGHVGPVTALIFTPDGKTLISGSTDQAVRLWRLPGGRPLKTLDGVTGENNCLVLSPDGRTLACSSGGGLGTDHTVRLWRIPAGKPLRALAGHSRYVSCLAMTADGHLLASGSGDGTIRLWAAELERLSALPARQATLQDLEWLQLALRDTEITAREKPALAFLEALLRQRRRLDILVEEAAPRVIEVGDFDIEIEG